MDTERACALLVGQLLGGMLAGLPLSRDETNCERWLHSPLLACGLEDGDPDLGEWISPPRLGGGALCREEKHYS